MKGDIRSSDYSSCVLNWEEEISFGTFIAGPCERIARKPSELNGLRGLPEALRPKP